MPDWNLT
jgi:hypothetical protein